MNLNKVFLLGRLTADPQLRTTQNGTQVATFSIATNRVWNDKVAGKREETEFHNIVVWARQAEVASRFLAKGSLVLVEGRIQTRGWEDKQGQKRKTTEVVAERIQLGPRASSNPQFKPADPISQNPETHSQTDMPTITIDEEIDDVGIKKEDLPF